MSSERSDMFRHEDELEVRVRVDPSVMLASKDPLRMPLVFLAWEFGFYKESLTLRQRTVRPWCSRVIVGQPALNYPPYPIHMPLANPPNENGSHKQDGHSKATCSIVVRLHSSPGRHGHQRFDLSLARNTQSVPASQLIFEGVAHKWCCDAWVR